MYNYKTEKSTLFTESGQVLFLQIRDHVNNLLKISGCFRMQEAISPFCGLNWQMLACVDRMVELGEIVEVTSQGKVAGQHRIFTRR